MDDATRHELDALRTRAYGPAADIASDPAAQLRLRELEAGLRAAAAPSAAVTAPAPAAPVRRPEDLPADDPAPRDRFAPIRVAPIPVAPPGVEQAVAEPAGTATVEASAPIPAATTSASAARRRARRIAVLWPLSVVVTAVLTYGALAVLSGRGGLTEAETLALTRDGASQGLFGTASDVVGASFHGLTVVRAMDVFGGPGVACLAVFPTTTDPAEMQGPIYTGCTAGALPAIVQVGVDDVSPAGLRQQYADGTGLRFVLDGDSVRVLVDGSGRVTPGA